MKGGERKSSLLNSDLALAIHASTPSKYTVLESILPREVIRTVVNSVDLGNLNSSTTGIKADVRPHSSPLGITTPNTGRNLVKSSSSISVVNPVLSFADLDRIFFQKILKKEDELKKAFSIIDSEQTLRVTKSQLRRIIEVYLLPLTRKQFNEVLSQIPLTSNGEVPYLEFLARFGRLITNVNSLKRTPGKQFTSKSLNQLECMLGEKIFKNVKSITKAFKLFDCTQSGQIHPSGLRQVLENYCFKMRDEEFEKLWNRYSLGKDTALDYNAFLKNLAMNINLNQKYNFVSKECAWRVKPDSKYVFSFSSTSGDGWENSSMDEIEAAFCKEFGVSTANIEKALSAFDTTKRGYVSLNYLKVVVDNFIFPLPKGIFLQLLKRLGFKTTGKIAWKQFLRKCQDCALAENGNMIPMRKKKRVCGSEPVFKESILVKLCRLVDDNFFALKKAFHTINPKQDGKITGKEMRHILSTVLWKVSDSEYKELMQILDPTGSGYINYITLLYLLEEDSSMMKKKRPNGLKDEKAPQFLAWDSVEEVLQDAISKNLQDFHVLLKTHDIGDTGLISRNHLKKILQTFCRYLTDEHLTKLCDKFQDVTSGGILYKKLLASIGIMSPIQDSIVTIQSFQSPNGSRRDDTSDRSKHSDYKNEPVRNKSLEEVIESLKNWIQQQDTSFRDTFLEYSRHPLEKISKEEFRKVLEDNGMPMDDEQFGLLVKKIGYKNEGLSYLDFASGFEASDAKPNGLESPGTPAVPASLTPKTSFESHFTSAEECLKIFPKKIKEIYGDAYSAFYKTDTNHDGIINMSDFRTLLHHMLITLKDEEFLRLLDAMNLKPGLTLNYREFRNLCEKKQFRKDDPPQRLIRPKPKTTDSELACDQAHNYLVSEAKNRWFDLSKNFLETDSEGNGILRRKDIRNALFGFDIPITPREFEKLWARYDTTQKGYVTYQEFLSRLGIEYSPSIHRPYAIEHFNFMGHFTKPEQIMEETKELQQYMEMNKPFKDKLKDHYQDINQAMGKLDKHKSSVISLNELHKLLQEYHPNITEEEITAMLKSLGIAYNDNLIYYHDFLKALENLKPIKSHSREKEEPQPISFSALTPEQALKKMKEMVTMNCHAFCKAFSACDKEDTGIIKASDFAQVIKDLCPKLKDSQYSYVLKKLRLHLNTHINWKFFLRNFPCFFEETAAEWTEKMQRASRPKSPKDQFLKEILMRIRDVVTTRYLNISQEFSDIDCCKSNLVNREDFRIVCNRHFQVLSDEQFESLWNELPLNSEGRLKYQEFLNKFNMEKTLSPPASVESLKRSGGTTPEAEAAQQGPAPAAGGSSAPGSASRPQTIHESAPGTASSTASRAWVPPLQNLEVIETKLRKKMQGFWKEMLKECKEKDVDKQGEITVADFQALVDKYNLDISKEECQHLITKYDLKNNGKFAYCDFFQSCVLLLKPKETSLMQRMKIQQVYMMKGAGTQSASFYAALLRIQPKILHCWRPMRRTFKSYDESGTGLLSIADFRKVLRQYGINLSEEEFFHILEYYDKTLSSKISYNDFLRAFLQ